MRAVTITVRDTNGKELFEQSCEVRDGVEELYVCELLPPGNRVLGSSLATVRIGTQGTTWKD